MRNDISILIKYLITFLHPVIMTLVIAGTFYAAYFGVQIKRIRNAEGEKRKEMVKAKYNQKHFQIASQHQQKEQNHSIQNYMVNQQLTYLHPGLQNHQNLSHL